MKAGRPISGYWATPVWGLRTEFQVGSVEERFMFFALACIPLWCPSDVPQTAPIHPEITVIRNSIT
jgi:hypothetical protein